MYFFFDEKIKSLPNKCTLILYFGSVLISFLYIKNLGEMIFFFYQIRRDDLYLKENLS